MLGSLSFVFPMYNEEENIERMVAETLAVAGWVARDYEIVIVDDASTDRSGELADRLASRHPEVRVIHHEVNRKLGGTLRTGFAAARKEFVLYIDSDLPIDMGDVPDAAARLDGADMLIGYRLSRAEGPKRAIMSWGYNRLIRAAFGLKVRDVNFAFKLFRRDMLKDVALTSEGSFIDAELLIEAHRHGYSLREHGLNYYPRVAGVSNLSGLGIVAKILREMAVYMVRRKPVDAAAKRARIHARKVVSIKDAKAVRQAVSHEKRRGREKRMG